MAKDCFFGSFVRPRSVALNVLYNFFRVKDCHLCTLVSAMEKKLKMETITPKATMPWFCRCTIHKTPTQDQAHIQEPLCLLTALATLFCLLINVCI